MPGTDLEDLFQSRSERVLRTLHANAWATLKLCSRIWIASRAKSEAKSKIIEAVFYLACSARLFQGQKGLGHVTSQERAVWKIHRMKWRSGSVLRF
jgi:hypothetical protein